MQRRNVLKNAGLLLAGGSVAPLLFETSKLYPQTSPDTADSILDYAVKTTAELVRSNLPLTPGDFRQMATTLGFVMVHLDRIGVLKELDKIPASSIAGFEWAAHPEVVQHIRGELAKYKISNEVLTGVTGIQFDQERKEQLATLFESLGARKFWEQGVKNLEDIAHLLEQQSSIRQRILKAHQYPGGNPQCDAICREIQTLYVIAASLALICVVAIGACLGAAAVYLQIALAQQTLAQAGCPPC